MLPELPGGDFLQEAPSYKLIWPFDHVVLEDCVTN